MTAKEHNKLISIFFFVQGGLQLFVGIIMVAAYGGIGGMLLTNSRRNEDQVVGGIFLALAVVVALFIVAISAFNLFTGFKLLKERRIGRVLGIVASCLAIISFPLGTALGVYGLWFFFGEKGKSFYNPTIGNNSFSAAAPPPSSWQ